MEKILTISQMKKKYHSEWLLIEDPETDESIEVVKGKVLVHSKDRDEIYREALRLHPKRFATFYTGVIPRNTAIVL